jgi:hypothetical protein
VRLRRPALVAIFAVAGLATLSNLSFLHQAYSSYRNTSEIERADLAALEIARNTVEPGFRLNEGVAHTAYVGIEAAPYFSAADAFGSPAYTEDELAAAPPPARAAADSVLASALGLTSAPATASVDTAACAAAGTPTDLPAGGATVVNEGSAPIQLRLRRFGDAFAIKAGTVDAGAGQTITIPTDLSDRPWQLSVEGEGTAVVCPAVGGGAG